MLRHAIYTCVRTHASGINDDMSEPLEPVAAWRAVLLAQSRAIRAIERDLDRADLISLGWYDVLLELNAAPDRRLRMQELGLRAVLSRTRVSRIVTELEAAGHVERVADPDDGRATLAAITRSGRVALRTRHRCTSPASINTSPGTCRSPSSERSLTGLQRVIDAHDAQIDPRR